MSPQTVIGDSNSKNIGWDIKTFFDFDIKNLMSDSGKSTSLIGWLYEVIVNYKLLIK